MQSLHSRTCPGRVCAMPQIHLRSHVMLQVRSNVQPKAQLERVSAPQMSEEERVLSVRREVTRRIKNLGEEGKTREAIEELAGLAKVGVQPDTLAGTALVKACCRDMTLAQSVFDELFADFLIPDEVSFVVLLRGYGGKTPPEWSKVDSTLTIMETQFGVVPTAISFNALLEICCRTNDLERGQDVIDRMISNGVVPDEFTEQIVSKKRALRSYLKKSLDVA